MEVFEGRGAIRVHYGNVIEGLGLGMGGGVKYNNGLILTLPL